MDISLLHFKAVIFVIESRFPQLSIVLLKMQRSVLMNLFANDKALRHSSFIILIVSKS